MLGAFLHNVLPTLINALEIIGILVILIGSLQTLYRYIVSLFSDKHFSIKKDLLDALALGLDFKLGAEIFRTVLVKDFTEILVLASIIALRAFLSFMIRFDKKSEVAEARLEREMLLEAEKREALEQEISAPDAK